MNIYLLENDTLKIELNTSPNKLFNLSNNLQIKDSWSTDDGDIKFTFKKNLQFECDNQQITVTNMDSKEIILQSSSRFLKKFNDNEQGFSLYKQPDEVIMGMGQDVEGDLTINNVERRCWNEWNGYDYLGANSTPYYLSSKGYSLFLETTYPSRFCFGLAHNKPKPIAHEFMSPTPYDWDSLLFPENKEDEIQIASFGDPALSIYLSFGDFSELARSYYSNTGNPSILPKWSLGYIQCKNRYKNEKEILHIAQKMKDKNIPCSAIVIDWLWFKEFGDLYWDGQNYSYEMIKTIKQLKEMGFLILLAVHPFIDKASQQYEGLESQGLLSKVPDNGRPYLDHTHPNTQAAMWKIYQKLYDEGIAGWWTDMGEPELDQPGTTAFAGERESYHNVYTLLWSKNIHEAQRNHDGSRNFCLARTNALGIHRYNTAYWTGDIFATWEIYRRNIKAVQTVALSGQQYVCTDIGGFHTDDRFTPELYIRWLQWGVYSGLFRVHGVKPENEPWSLGVENEAIITDIIKSRYRIIPYIYSYSRLMNKNKGLLISPMILHHQNDTNIADFEYQFYFGEILVCPITKPDQRFIDIYLPENEWYDVNTNTYHAQSGHQIVSSPINTMPRFIKSGNILIETDITETIKDNYSQYNIFIYGDSDSSFYIYEDDGKTYQYEEDDSDGILLNFANGKLTISSENLPAWYDNIPERELCITHINKDGKSTSTLVHKIGTSQTVDFASISRENIKPNIQAYFDTTNADYSGAFKLNCSVISEDYSDVYLKIDKPKSYFIKSPQVDLPESLDFSSDVHVEPSASVLKKSLHIQNGQKQETFELRPYRDLLEQKEYINVSLVESNTDKTLITEKVSIGNGYLKGWKYAVSNTPDVDISILNQSKYRDLNPWGYIYLYQYLNMQENGICPVDFIEIIQKIGFGYAKCDFFSPFEDTRILRIRADEQCELLLNGENIYESQEFTIEKDIVINIKKGINTIESRLSWKSPRPFTGREFGISAQILNMDGSIDLSVQS